MPLIVETGQGLENANGYADVETVRDYWEDRAEVITADDIELEAAIVIASQFVDLKFGPRFIGKKADPDQALEWPRKCAGPYPDDTVPRQLVKAVAEYAKRQTEAALQPDPGTAGEVVETTEILQGVGELTTRYAEGTARTADDVRHPLAEGYLAALLGIGGMNYLKR
jgi:hypothetical protein